SGSANCPLYATCELLGDKLERNLPNFSLTKIIIPPYDWQNYAERLAKKHGWPKMASPIIWRECVDTGGMTTLIGDARDFQEYVFTYYGQLSQFTSQKLLQIAEENQRWTEETVAANVVKKVMQKMHPVITIVGAESPTAARLCMMLAMARQSDDEGKVSLCLFPGNLKNLQAIKGLKETLEESACWGVRTVKISTGIADAVSDASVVVILDVVPRQQEVIVDGVARPRESRADWLNRRFAFFYKLGEHLQTYAQPSVKVIVAGSLQLFEGAESVAAPLNFDVQSLHVACKDKIPVNNIVGLPRALEYRMKAAIGRQLGVHRCDLVDLILWGNIDNCFFADISQARVYRRHGQADSETGPAWFNLAAEPLIFDKEALYSKVLPSALEELKSPSTNQAALCHASAIFSFIDEWHFGHPHPHEMIASLVVSSVGLYGLPTGMAFSFPVTLRPQGRFEICQDIVCDVDKKRALEECIRDALTDWSVVNPVPLSNFLKSVVTVEGEVSGHGTDDSSLSGPTAFYTPLRTAHPVDHQVRLSPRTAADTKLALPASPSK
uniref:Malate dehydrogenase 1B n=3 Tax=Mesocestoides corti TaxID=53468 RepID=A0A5K3F9K9_MESCO